MTTAQKIIKYCAIGLAVLIILSMIGGVFALVSAFKGNDHDGKLEETQELLSADDGVYLKSIDVDLLAVSLKVVSGDKLRVETNSKYVSCEYENNRLVIKEEERPFGLRFSCAGVSTNEELLTLTLPRVSAPERVDLKAGAGNIDIDFLIAEYIDFEFGAGEVKLYDLKIHGANIRGGAGKMTLLSSEIQNLSLEMGVGALKLEASLFGNNKINCGVGQVDITLLGAPENYRVKIQKGLGSVDVDGLDENGDIYGNGDNLIEISGGVGSISVHLD